MITHQQRLGTYSMSIGSILYSLFLVDMNPIPQIVSFQPLLSISMMIAGSILSYGLKEIDDRFLKALGVNMYIIGAAYECKGISTPISYASCSLGGLLVMGGVIFTYLKKGKPTVSTIIIQFCMGFLLCGSASAEILDFLWNSSTTECRRMHPKSIDLVTVQMPLGVLNLLLGALLYYILKKKTEEGRVEPDVIFLFSRNTVFDQIYNIRSFHQTLNG
ncbi:hypothetical protein AVEN_211219-1 [Araneus ventricosus]|uniref:Uncharacterized protein n=1 Tax=Araneus ventricosus TaxID=182803 RepID=A0A4Y2M2F6_ARAVE|nr:hypothetical protein AVEN_211219-1 [Araneus ventricosus]